MERHLECGRRRDQAPARQALRPNVDIPNATHSHRAAGRRRVAPDRPEEGGVQVVCLPPSVGPTLFQQLLYGQEYAAIQIDGVWTQVRPDGGVYWWCCHHESWGKHTRAECRLQTVPRARSRGRSRKTKFSVPPFVRWVWPCARRAPHPLNAAAPLPPNRVPGYGMLGWLPNGVGTVRDWTATSRIIWTTTCGKRISNIS